MERRKFLRSACGFCVLGAAGLLLPEILTSCGTSHATVYKTTIDQNRITVPLALFDNSTLQMVRPKGWFYDIAVIKNQDNTFSALLMKCTHMDNQLSVAGDGFSCSLHGSHFDKKGTVKKGPAERPLTNYKTTIEQTNITIYV